MKRTARTRIAHQDAGLTLINYLTSRFTYHTQDEWCQAIAEQRVLINGKVQSADFVLSAKDELNYLIPDIPEPSVDTNYEVIYEDKDLLAINKPGNLPCHPAGKYFHHTLWALLKERFPDDPIGLVNRLDRETSGIILIARNAQATRACRRQFDQRTVKKVYHVLVEGKFPQTLNCRGHLQPDPESQVRKKRRFISSDNPADGPERDWAVTHFQLISQHGPIALIKAIPETGRLHQIRATLCSLNFPVVGDKLYGINDQLFLRFLDGTLSRQDKQLLRLPRQALHATSLSLNHPVNNTPITFTTPLPNDMKMLIAPELTC